MLRVMLVDDEPPARRALKRLLEEHDDVAVVGEAGSVAEARQALRKVRPDVVFMDVEMGDGEGFEMLDGAGPQPDVVFVTAYSRYAVHAFEVAAADFLVKPVDPERLALTVQRLRQRHDLQGERNGRDAPAPDKDRLLINLPGARLSLPFQAVLSLTAEGDFTRIAISGGREQLVCRLLGQFEADLPRPPFLRLSRSILVNLAQVDRVEWLEGGRAQLFLDHAKHMVPLGRAAARRLRQMEAPA
ncbi:LytTR family DNA-binding domain-containing protein [Xanthobacter sp. DSM 24535]|uniref:LytR/AlgR family response regulator transcription factor n=1 Tax=Roseixanthobacter psychrophilus TaxID=3119917 RepID=UPI003726CBDB